MGAASLGSRAIIGSFFAKLEQDMGNTWIPGVSMLFKSNQESETYKWLGQSPAMREWVGGRNAKGFRENGVTITNKTYEATLEVLVDEIRRDKTGQVMLRIAELASRTNAHWAKLLTALIVANGTCYDGSAFFADAHSEGDSGSQDNNLTSAAATSTQPTSAEAADAIMTDIAAMLAFKDDQGEPMNENAKQFLCMIPPVFLPPFAAAVGSAIIVNGSSVQTNVVQTMGAIGGFQIKLAVNPRLTTTSAFYCFRTDGDVKPFICQEEEGVTVSAIAEGSEEEFKNNRHLYGVKAIRNVGLGYWQHAVLHTFS